MSVEVNLCGCGKTMPVTRRLCRSCVMRRNNADPEITAKRIAGIRSSPILKPGSPLRMRLGKRCAEVRRANPEWRAWASENMRRNIQPLSITPEGLARRDDAARGRSVSNTKLAWCPHEYRQLYRHLMRKHGMTSIEAKRLVFDQESADRNRILQDPLSAAAMAVVYRFAVQKNLTVGQALKRLVG